jgi:hypothetical protein
MVRRRLKVRDLDDVVFWGPNLICLYNVFGYGVGSSIVDGIVKS